MSAVICDRESFIQYHDYALPGTTVISPREWLARSESRAVVEQRIIRGPSAISHTLANEEKQPDSVNKH